MKARFAAMLLAGAALPAAAVAQGVATQIVADSQADRSLGTIVSSAGTEHVIDGGARAGPNLFHSFARFDLGQGDIARWVHTAGDSAGIANVVNRVTGGLPSQIFGTLDSSALPNADFWFINPAGILFGEGARIDVPAAAHFSTAQELRFAQGPAFAVTTPGGSTFSIADPAAFGFLGDQGVIAIDGVDNLLAREGRLVLAARDVEVRDSNLAGTGFALFGFGAGAGEIAPTGPSFAPGSGVVSIEGSTLRLARGAEGSTGIRLAGGTVRAILSMLGTPFSDDGASAGGPIDISGAAVEILASLVSASTFGAEDAGGISIAGDNIFIGGNSVVTTDTRFGSTGSSADLRVTAADTIRIDRAFVSASTQTGRAGGSVILQADRVEIANGGVVAAQALPTSSADAGSVLIDSRVLEMGPAAAITSSTLGSGAAGAIVINASESALLRRSGISSSAESEESGGAGSVSITTGDLRLLDQSIISTATFGRGDAGFILVDAGSVLLDEASGIETISAAGAIGNAGLVAIRGRSVVLAGESSISSDTRGAGNGGGVLVQASEIELREGARISSDSLALCFEEPCASGAAGGVAIVADRLRLLGSTDFGPLTRISSETRGTGDAGSISIATGSLDLEGAAAIASDSFGAGRGGTIGIEAGRLSMSDGAFLSSGAFGPGAGGTIDVDAGTVRIERGAAIVAQSSFPDGGTGGSIVIRADDILLRDEAEINTTTRGRGDAGSIELVAGKLEMDRYSLIGSDSLDQGNGGSIRLTADEMRITGGSTVAAEALGSCGGSDCGPPGRAGDIVITAGAFTLAGFEDEFGVVRSTITSSTAVRGNAGDVTVVADTVLMDAGRIASDTTGEGDAGSVKIVAGDVSLARGSTISTGSTDFCGDLCSGIGDAGDVAIVARGAVSLSSGSTVSSSTGANGEAGQIEIVAAALDVDDSLVSSTTAGSGNAGAILITAGSVRIASLGAVETQADFGSEGAAGRVAIKADQFVMTDAGRISSSSDGRGQAGRISVSAGSILIDRQSAVLTSAGLEALRAGLIELDADLIRIDNGSFVSSSTFGAGIGGDVVLTADRVEVAEFSSILSATAGAGSGGNVFIEAGDVDLSMGADISSRAEQGSTGNGGLVSVIADRLTMRTAASLSSETFGSGAAGLVAVDAGTVELDEATISSSALSDAGTSGAVVVAADSLAVSNGGSIQTNSVNANAAGDVAIVAGSLRVQGAGSTVSSANQSEVGGDAGTIVIEAGSLAIVDGGEVSTGSRAGAAGDIAIMMPSDAVLRLEGRAAPGVITTSSGPGTGGRIIIAAPYAIVSNGGSILALGEQGGANVQIQTDYFISSADRTNQVAVDGSFLLEAQVGDVSSGTVERDLSVIDASGVLRGQCAAVRVTGRVSQLVVPPVGPYGTSGDDSEPRPTGSCS